MGLGKPAGIAAAVLLALSAAAMPGARSASAAEAGASEEYRVSGSGGLTYSARITASADYLSKQVCDDFAGHLRTVFGLDKDPKASYTGATYDGGTSECAVQPFDIHPTDSVITENGSERTIAMSPSTTDPVLEAIGFTTRSATATVSNAIITSASDGCAIDHDSSSSGQETATCAHTADDSYVTYDVATGATSSGAVRGAPTPVPPDPEANVKPQRTGTPGAPAATTTTGPITAPVTVGTPGQRTSAPTPTGRSSDSDDGNAFVAIFFLILVVLVLFWIISMGTMRSQWKKQSRRPARSRATPTRRPVDPALPYDSSRTAASEPHDSPTFPYDTSRTAAPEPHDSPTFPYDTARTAASEPHDSPAFPYDTSRTAASEPHDSPDPAPGSAGPSEAAAPRSDSRFAPPSGPA